MLNMTPSNQVRVYHPKFKLHVVISVDTWLSETDKSIRTRAESIAAGNAGTRNPDERWAALWLQACNLTDQTKIDGYLERRPLFDQPGDLPKTVRCEKCGRVLTDKMSVALGIGPICRAKK